ncbi:MAG: hypothetical protein RhofKO_25900 [Rhodothermales bacterium]
MREHDYLLGPAVLLTAPTLNTPLSQWTLLAYTRGDLTADLQAETHQRVQVDQLGPAAVAELTHVQQKPVMLGAPFFERDLERMQQVQPGLVKAETSGKTALKINTSIHPTVTQAIAVVPLRWYQEGAWFGRKDVIWMSHAYLKTEGRTVGAPIVDDESGAETYAFRVEIMQAHHVLAVQSIGNPSSSGLPVGGVEFVFNSSQGIASAVVGGAALPHTRGTAGMYIDANGDIQTAAIDVLRFQEGAALLEPQGDQYITSQALVNGGTETSNGLGPGVNAWAFEGGGTVPYYGGAPVPDGPFCAYVVIDHVTVPSDVFELSLYAWDGTDLSRVEAEINWQAKTIGAPQSPLGAENFADVQSGMRPIGGGRYLAWVAGEILNGAASGYSRIYFLGASAGTTIRSGAAKIERSRYPTSYIIPDGVGVTTRNADSPLTWAQAVSYAAAEGLSLYVQFGPLYDSGVASSLYEPVVSIGTNDAANTLRLVMGNNADRVIANVLNGGVVAQSDYTYGDGLPGTIEAIMRVGAGGLSLSTDGGDGPADVGDPWPDGTTLTGETISAGWGLIRRVALVRGQMTLAQMQSLFS